MDVGVQRFGELLRLLRDEGGLSQLELGARAGVSARHISFIETGRSVPSAAMVGKLGSALGLGARTVDELRHAAGFARRGPSPRLGDRVFACAIGIERSSTLAQVLAFSRSILPELGVAQFFFGTLRGGGGGRLDWVDLGTFPAHWLRTYDRERYAATDPLLAVVRDGRSGFFWDDVIDRRRLTDAARTMFDSAAARGIRSGFVAARVGRCETPLLSMMGPAMDHRDAEARLGLEIVGARMIDAFERLGVG